MAPKSEGMNSETGNNRSGTQRRTAKDSDEYRRRRERNNVAVKKSRAKTKQKTQQMLERVSELRSENEMLEEKIAILTKELGFLKDLFLAHAGNAHGVNLNETELTKLLREDTEVDEGVSLLLSLSQGSPRSQPLYNSPPNPHY
ncbi:CCAAT/enhancer-binding protein gamma-like [Oratosquilla oratoria]|uniref:CCAAT/enhancer-binding protein gamma-like n=1 Tax=Oratosquilla oratoria TaxID=337810 RepID=UPI003F757E06